MCKKAFDFILSDNKEINKAYTLNQGLKSQKIMCTGNAQEISTKNFFAQNYPVQSAQEIPKFFHRGEHVCLQKYYWFKLSI